MDCIKVSPRCNPPPHALTDFDADTPTIVLSILDFRGCCGRVFLHRGEDSVDSVIIDFSCLLSFDIVDLHRAYFLCNLLIWLHIMLCYLFS